MTLSPRHKKMLEMALDSFVETPKRKKMRFEAEHPLVYYVRWRAATANEKIRFTIVEFERFPL